MTKNPSKLVHLVNQFYQFVQLSLFFWERLFSKAIVYGWIESIYAILYLNHYPEFQEMGYSEKRIEIRLNLKHQKKVSLIFSFLLASIAFILWYQVRFVHDALFLLIVLGMFLQIFMVYIVWVAFLAIQEPSGAFIFAKAFDKMIRRFSVSFSIWLLFVFSMLIAYMNLIIFFMIVPGLCLKIIDKLLKRDEVLRMKRITN